MLGRRRLRLRYALKIHKEMRKHLQTTLKLITPGRRRLPSTFACLSRKNRAKTMIFHACTSLSPFLPYFFNIMKAHSAKYFSRHRK